MDDNNPLLEDRLKAKAKSLGFIACGITHAAHDWGNALDGWIATGAHGEMGWMADRADVRAGPNRMWPEAKSALSLAMSYAPEIDPRAGENAPSQGRISVYAQGADYHDIVKKALKALARWLVEETSCALKVFVDTAPVMEKPLAAAAGLGWQGKHTNLVSRNHGSWLFLGAIYTDLPLTPDPPEEDHCGSCMACQAACPTNAFPAPYRLDARRCISYLTIEHNGPIPHEFRRAMGNRIYGCDDCLAACPWNKFADAAAANLAFAAREGSHLPRLSELLELDDPAFRERFRGSPIKRIGRDRMVRNAAIAAGNSGDQALMPLLKRLQNDPALVVADAASWAIKALSAPPA